MLSRVDHSLDRGMGAFLSVQIDILNRLRCPVIVLYQDSFIVNNTLHLVMDYCEGGDLATKIRDAKSHFSEDVSDLGRTASLAPPCIHTTIL